MGVGWTPRVRVGEVLSTLFPLFVFEYQYEIRRPVLKSIPRLHDVAPSSSRAPRARNDALVGRRVNCRGCQSRHDVWFYVKDVSYSRGHLEPQTVTQYWHLEAIIGPAVHR